MGPLHGVRIVEMSNIGPGPYCGMLLADLGADVVRVDRLTAADIGIEIPLRYDFLNRNKKAVAINLKDPAGIEIVKTLVASADMLIEGFRPGVMERLGLGPDVCMAANPRLIYGRMTGWGQEGRMSHLAGHDINYISMMGALAAIGPKDGAPTPPLNLVGDFAGGSLFLAMGLLAALHETKQSGKGQVIDAAMVDGVANLMAMHLGYRQAGIWENARGSNAVDGGSPYYTTYLTQDGKYIAVGCVERRFYLQMLAMLGLTNADLPEQNDKSRWGELRARLASLFLTKTRDEWAVIFADSDACVTPVLDMDECLRHPVAVERNVFVEQDGAIEPNPAPRFSRTPAAPPSAPNDPRLNTHATLKAWGMTEASILAMAKSGVIPPQT